MNNFEYYIETNGFHCKFAKGKPAVRGNEFHEYDEIVMILGGNVKFVSKNIQEELQPNDVVWISKEQFHQFIVSDDEPYTRCIIAVKKASPLTPFINEIMSGVLLSRQSDNICEIFGKIISAVKGNFLREEKELLIGALITQLLFERKYIKTASDEMASDPSSFISRVISYIDDNYNKDLTVKDIALNLHVSESTLFHKFKKELNMSVYHYITEKRLSVTRQYISSGYSISKAAMLSGFKDYGSFFRICKSHYGVNPSGLLTTNNADEFAGISKR